jgi:hypothetical protein
MPPSRNRRYDYGVLKRILNVEQLWGVVCCLDAQRLLSLLESDGYQEFIRAYAQLCRAPLTDETVDILVRNLRRSHSKRRAYPTAAGGRILETEHELGIALGRLKADLVRLDAGMCNDT